MLHWSSSVCFNHLGAECFFSLCHGGILTPPHILHLQECHLSQRHWLTNCRSAQVLAENRVCCLFHLLSPVQSISSDLLLTPFRPAENDPTGSCRRIAEQVVVDNMWVTRALCFLPPAGCPTFASSLTYMSETGLGPKMWAHWCPLGPGTRLKRIPTHNSCLVH